MSSHGANAYYPFFVLAYRASRKVQRMTYVARGLYRELLDEQFLEGSLPDDIGALADICGCPVKVMEKAWVELAPCFHKVDERLVNLKLEEIRTERDRLRVKRVESGRLGGIAKQTLASARQMPYRREEKSKEKKSRAKQQKPPEASPSTSQSDLVLSSLGTPGSRPDDFVATWNEMCGGLPKVTALTDVRRRKIQTRYQAGLRMEEFTQAVNLCATTPFLNGSNGRGWRADFDWLLTNDTNIVKVREGKYGEPARTPAADAPKSALPVHEFQSTAIPLSEARKALTKGAIQ
jgi:uncharacterized protein YdaU (DUF1376 family)